VFDCTITYVLLIIEHNRDVSPEKKKVYPEYEAWWAPELIRHFRKQKNFWPLLVIRLQVPVL